jgi:ABC-2 type transport system permease protein
MNKTLIVAASEFTTLTRSKAFLIGLFMMPVFMGAVFGLQKMTREVADTRDRPFAVVDPSGRWYPVMAAAADEWNRNGQAGGASRSTPRFLPQRAESASSDPDATRAQLSDRVRRGELYAFVEIPPDIVDPARGAKLRYYSNHPADRQLPGWIEATVNREVLNQRFRAASLDRTLVTRLTRRVEVSELGLYERDARGGIKAAAKVDQMRTMGIPLAMMMILLFSVMAAAPQLFNSVIEEKMSRISEVLIGSVTPFELMMGKLLGSVTVSLLLAAIYIVGGTFVARHFGYSDAIRPTDFGWLFLFLVMAVFMFGAIFIAIGAACSDLKDAQGMMTPAMLIMMIPWMTWFAVVRAPESMMAITLSLIPTATPFLMLLRIVVPPGPPLWQVALGLVMTGIAAVAVVYAAGKIFRTGLLMQGKAPTIGEMLRWVRADS